MAQSPYSFPPPGPAASQDELMTADRDEHKYLLEAQRAGRAIRQLDAQLQRHVHGDTRLPGARLYATTVYFDTKSRHLFHRAESAEESVKLRAREYYALDPSMVQLARRTAELMRFDRVLWFELKHKTLGHVRKRRFGIPKPDVPRFLSDGHITDEMIDVQARHFGDNAQTVLQEVSALCQHYREPFVVDCIVNYRRVAWQDRDGLLRLTLDRDVRFFAPPENLWARDVALSAEALGTPCATLEQAIIEVKSRGVLPSWLDDTLKDSSAVASNFSKFVTASRHVHASL